MPPTPEKPATSSGPIYRVGSPAEGYGKPDGLNRAYSEEGQAREGLAVREMGRVAAGARDDRTARQFAETVAKQSIVR